MSIATIEGRFLETARNYERLAASAAAVDQVATALCERTGVHDPALRTLTALAAAAPRGGHVCVDVEAVDGAVVLRRASATGAWPLPDPVELPPLIDWAPRALEEESDPEPPLGRRSPSPPEAPASR